MIKLYAVPASHPCAAVEAALRLKQLDYRRTDLLPVVHRLQGRLTHGAHTVPGIVLASGEKVAGSRAIMRRLDELAPEPPLLPVDPVQRRRVEDADRWGDEVLQPLVRRLSWAALRRSPKAMESYARDARLPLPLPLMRPSLPLVAAISSRYNHVRDPAGDLAALPGALDHVDELISDGVVGGDDTNVADLQIGASIQLARTFGDLVPMIDGRPCAHLAEGALRPVVGSAPAGLIA